MKELGGYFSLEQLPEHPYYPTLVALNSARNALEYVCRAKYIKRLLLPYYLCDVLARMCDERHIETAYYHVGRDFLPAPDTRLGQEDWLLVVNYYGQLDHPAIRALKSRFGRVIVDNTDAFFAQPCDDIDTLYSCRKFFGVADGAYLATNTLLDETLPIAHSADRMAHLLGRMEYDGASYFTAFQHNDDSLCSLPMQQMSRITQNILGAIDYESVIARRNANYAALARRLDASNGLRLNVPVGPFAYPYYCENAPQYRKALIAQKMYIPLLWPNVLALENCDAEKDLAQNILPLPCDQRYAPADMEEMAHALMAAMG